MSRVAKTARVGLNATMVGSWAGVLLHALTYHCTYAPEVISVSFGISLINITAQFYSDFLIPFRGSAPDSTFSATFSPLSGAQPSYLIPPLTLLSVNPIESARSLESRKLVRVDAHKVEANAVMMGRWVFLRYWEACVNLLHQIPHWSQKRIERHIRVILW